jgi:hypothetical protein
MTRFVSSLGLLGATLVDLSLCACGTNDHPTVIVQVDAGPHDSGTDACIGDCRTGNDSGSDAGHADGGLQPR